MRFLKKFRNIFSKKISLAVIFVEYDRQKCGRSDRVFNTLQGYLANLQDCRITYLRVDNKRAGTDLEKINKSVYTVGGDNTFREFSGWQKGIEAINHLNIKCNIVLITNEMFLKPGPSFLQDYSTEETLTRCLNHNKVIGRIDTAGQQYNVFGYDVSSWICTNAFFVSREALNQLHSVVLINDNIHDVIEKNYPSKHLLDTTLIDTNTPEEIDFSITLSLTDDSPKEIRCRFDILSSQTPPPPSTRFFNVILTEISFNNIACSKDNFIRGIFDNDSGELQTSHSFLLSLPPIPGNLTIKGYLPIENLKKPPSHSIQISVYNDSYLYKKDAPINLTYQRWLVEWLTERWHSRFNINAETWELFKTKASAIINESLLTAKLIELGYNSESYGDKKYY